MFNELIYLFTPLLIVWRDWLNFLEKGGIIGIIIFLLIGFMLIEILIENSREYRRLITRSYLTNMATFVFNNTVLSILSISSLLMLADRYRDYGLLAGYDKPLQVVLAFILFDLVLYLWHRAAHRYEILWLFHRVHHSDKSMNASTAFRVHFMEVLLTTVVKAVYIVVMGISSSVVFFCESISILFTMFHHLNMSFKSEKWLKWIFIVPSLHRTHHSPLRKEHDSNYGAVFSIWDRIFQTLLDIRTVEVGLSQVGTLNFYQLLKFGLFPNSSDLKTTPAPTVPDKQLLRPETFQAMVAEAAYYKSEHRGFMPGFDFLDWIEAEQEIKNAIL